MGAFLWGEAADGGTDGGPQAVNGARGGLAQQGLELGAGILDWIEVRAVGRRLKQPRAGGLDRRPHARTPVAAEMVQDHRVAGLQPGQQDLLDIGLAGEAVDRAVGHHRRQSR